MPDGTVTLPRRVWCAGEGVEDSDDVVVESPVALVYNGVSHAVMMATPMDLEDLALGFSLSEGILRDSDQLLDLQVATREQGVEVAMQITGEPFAALKHRRRQLTGRSGCGLCGVESLEQAVYPPHSVSAEVQTTHEAIQAALDGLAATQELKRRTGGVHAAAWCSAQGDILLVREDVGRHNALDKLLGALALRASDSGFILLTSRIGYEMVAKAAACNVALLAAVSAPTSLAVAQAQQAGMSLVGFVQRGRQVIYCGEHRVR
ncbi:formate dehydrogenase accessory sulfurtransferase FdhD [Pseudohalioglobus sediminis]|uniref:Sulfur carrier protein FdhD n=1 Tax=Pseudohalioglobus sediminis TaxID=2606449 RepID=A0A5B0X644_9GAMM|nr:formate dehydrogenase accessory sulfurtransferase FdhD [Pseudohalioglobus sediminis]KAA1194145.1 formate dehydrogenase accessory sulfurtransferase FdhD [Pseudohalioglobus sediminis]